MSNKKPDEAELTKTGATHHDARRPEEATRVRSRGR